MKAVGHRAASAGSTAFRFVVVLGIANFFADMTYEGARSVIGPFLGTLGASAAIVGFTVGFGELPAEGFSYIDIYRGLY
jgi:hypothetical protein